MSTKKPSHEVKPEYLANLLAKGYTPEVRDFTKDIQTDHKLVMALEAVFDVMHQAGSMHWEGTASQKAFIERAAGCLEEMRVFLSGKARPVESYVVVINHRSDVTVEIGWLEQMAGQVLWDRWSVEVDDPVMAFANIGFLFDRKGYRCEDKPVEKPDHPLYRFHPERFKSHRDYAEPVSKLYRQKVDPMSGLPTLEQLNDIVHFVMTEMNQKAMTFPRKLKDAYPLPSLVMDAERSLAMAYGRFVQAGRQIMDFPPALTDMLAKTNVDDIPLNNINLPYRSQYLCFGARADLELEPGWLVDGAYVESLGTAGDIGFTLTAVPRDHSLSRLWYLIPEPEYAQQMVGDFRCMDLATATDMVLSDELANLQERQNGAGGDITDSLREEFDRQDKPFPDDIRIKDIAPEMAGTRLDVTSRRHPIYQAALRLIVNALCYVAAYPDDIDTVWPDGTPRTLKQKVLRGKGKERQRAKSKLAALGYVPVHICGKHIAEQLAAHVNPETGLRHVTTHWRRGHWRNQAHGPARSLRKLIWVMPVLVGSKGEGEPDSGHLYLVT